VKPSGEGVFSVVSLVSTILGSLPEDRIYIELVNGPFPYEPKGTPTEYKTGLSGDRARLTGATRERDIRSVHSNRRGAFRRWPKGWRRPFEDPIDLPRGRQLVALQDAADVILKARFLYEPKVRRASRKPASIWRSNVAGCGFKNRGLRHSGGCGLVCVTVKGSQAERSDLGKSDGGIVAEHCENGAGRLARRAWPCCWQ
jgi:hypothetical protein